MAFFALSRNATDPFAKIAKSTLNITSILDRFYKRKEVSFHDAQVSKQLLLEYEICLRVSDSVGQHKSKGGKE